MQEEIRKSQIEWSEKQLDYVLKSTHSWNIASGVTRSGKTYAQIMRWYDFMYNEAEPNTTHLMTGKTSESLKWNLLEPILKQDKANDIEIKGNPPVLYIKSRNIKCRCVGCDNERATARVQGGGVNSWWADEIVEHPWTVIEMASSRCSEGGIIRPIFGTCNPSHPLHKFKTDVMDNPKIDVKNWYFGFPDNPGLSSELIEQLKNSYQGVFYNRMILGLWSVVEGVVYDRFKMSEHVKDEAPKTFIRYVLGIDWGYEHALALTLYGVENDGTWWQIDEYKESGKLVDNGLLRELETKGWFDLPIYGWDGKEEKARLVKPEIAYADSARPEYIRQFEELTGITTMKAVKHDKLSCIQTVMKRYNKKENGKYGLYYLNKCKKTLEEKMAYRWKSGSKDDVIKENDDLMDCEMYALHTDEAGCGKLYIPEYEEEKRLVRYKR